MNEIEKLKRKIIYRAKSIGYKELNLIFEKFIKQNIEQLNHDDLTLFLEIVNMDDQEIINYILYDKKIDLNNKILKDFIIYSKNYIS
jgi:succinate dehydrogenase flavin-adding protein (antitoxin of CptAB toxin-antitoxin module)